MRGVLDDNNLRSSWDRLRNRRDTSRVADVCFEELDAGSRLRRHPVEGLAGQAQINVDSEDRGRGPAAVSLKVEEPIAEPERAASMLNADFDHDAGRAFPQDLLIGAEILWELRHGYARVRVQMVLLHTRAPVLSEWNIPIF